MKEMLGDKFKNENTTMLGEVEFKEFFPNHKKSNFTKDVQDKLSKHGNIVKSFAMPNPARDQHEASPRQLTKQRYTPCHWPACDAPQEAPASPHCQR